MSSPTSSALAIQCPACHTGYLLPRHMLGSLGARVTCPGCGAAFDIDRDGRLEAAAPPGRPDAARDDAASEPARLVARDVLDALAARIDASLRAAALEGRVFAAHGADLMAAYDDFRRRAGAGASPEAFREELRRRWNVELIPTAESRS